LFLFSFFFFVLCLMCPMLTVFLDCPFMIVRSVFSYVYICGVVTPLRRVFVLYLFYVYSDTYKTDVQSNFHVILCSCRLILSRRVLLVERELWTFPEHLYSAPGFLVLANL
jgi:hypothetical protein